MTILKIWVLIDMGLLALVLSLPARAQQMEPSLRACQMKLGNEVTFGLQASASAFAMQDKIAALEKELADEKAKSAKPSDPPSPEASADK